MDGVTDTYVVADKFSHYFSRNSSTNNANRANELLEQFTVIEERYCGSPFINEYFFDVELVNNVIDNLKPGRAAAWS